ncbi:hypothetical protein B0H66DRAFT_127465 [Apodospora peruviana]|uniref:GAR domain-containing protein n=1 Tax=Apodospora peruviana TaxID=516989 RepID=A0AAE0IIE8_9PEZI|nr:hypothetical protein B0H66DRAFT_127465 [Apodospora peruviana]
MNDHPPSLPPPNAQHLALPPTRGRQHRTSMTSSDPPSIRQYNINSDDLLSNLTPRSAVEAFRNPSGGLKACMDTATPSEQAFALRTALASKDIQEWLDELSSWPWPSRGGPAGFEAPVVAEDDVLTSGEVDKPHYLGSLLATDVARYEARIDEISHAMEQLDVDEIKKQVLLNHIMPLSRPGSPAMLVDSPHPRSARTSSSSFSRGFNFVRMDDLTALITATTVQALPNLSRLSRLLNAWSLRLLVLKRITVFMDSLTDGEVALQAGWDAVNTSVAKHVEGENVGGGNATTSRSSSSAASLPSATLSRKEFGVMKSILERKVAKAGRDLDVMLDLLEASEDTLPEKWIDRVDSLEREYGEWTVMCERKIREADWARIKRETMPVPVANTPTPRETERKGGNGSSGEITEDGGPAGAAADPEPLASVTEQNKVLPTKLKEDAESRNDDELFVDGKDVQPKIRPSVAVRSNGLEDNRPPTIKVHTPTDDARGAEHYDDDHQFPEAVPAEDQVVKSIEDVWNGEERNVPSPFDGSNSDGSMAKDTSPFGLDGNVGKRLLAGIVLPQPRQESEGAQLDHGDSDFDFDDALESDAPEPELPTLPRPRRDSDISIPSTVVHGADTTFPEFSSDPPDHGTPELLRLRDADFSGPASDDFSPADSPSAFRSSIRSQSVSFNDMPTVPEIPDDEASPKTPSQSFIVSDDLPRDPSNPGNNAASNSDDQLQQQISEILESVPAKIRLTSEPAAINLNPPDFMMPAVRKPSKPDGIPRSHSSLSTVSNSSRSGTPSFTLAPAFNRNVRSRNHQRDNQEIKLYHLSRSNGEAPIKLFIRCVGENERVMVRVGGGWADLGEYLKEYASHHGRRSAAGGDSSKVEVKDFPRVSTSRAGSTPPSRPETAQASYSSPVSTPLHVRKTRKPAAAAAVPTTAAVGGDDVEDKQQQQQPPKTPRAASNRPPRSTTDSPSPGGSTTARSRSRSSSRLSWTEEDSSLGMAGPRAKQIEMSEESKAWVESVKEKVRIASGDIRKVSENSAAAAAAAASSSSLVDGGKFGEIGKVGATKRLFRRQG